MREWEAQQFQKEAAQQEREQIAKLKQQLAEDYREEADQQAEADSSVQAGADLRQAGASLDNTTQHGTAEPVDDDLAAAVHWLEEATAGLPLAEEAEYQQEAVGTVQQTEVECLKRQLAGEGVAASLVPVQHQQQQQRNQEEDSFMSMWEEVAQWEVKPLQPQEGLAAQARAATCTVQQQEKASWENFDVEAWTNGLFQDYYREKSKVSDTMDM